MRCVDSSYVKACEEFLVGSGGDALYAKFVRQALPQINVGALRRKNNAALSQMFRSMYDFLCHLEGGAPKVKVFSISYGDINGVVKRTAIMALNQDMPFILKSMIELLRKHNIAALYTLHPVLHIQRDSSGAMLDILDAEYEGKDESLIYLELAHMAIDKQAQQLESLIVDIYENLARRFDDGCAAARKFHAVIDNLSAHPAVIRREYAAELIDFKSWVHDGNFTFFGYVRYNLPKSGDVSKLKLVEGGDLVNQGDLGWCDAGTYVRDGEPVFLYVGASEAPVGLAFKCLSYIDLVEFDEGGQSATCVHRFFGLLSYDVQYQSAAVIPVIRRKVAQIKALSNVSSGGHSHRLILSVLQSFPRKLLFSLSAKDVLADTLVIVDAVWSGSAAVTLGVFSRGAEYSFIYITMCVPRSDLAAASREEAVVLLQKKLGAEVVYACTGVEEYDVLRQHFIAKVATSRVSSEAAHLDELGAEMASILRSWDEVLREELVARGGEQAANNLMCKYAFSSAYKEMFSPREGYRDILRLEKLALKTNMEISLYRRDHSDALCLKLYSKKGAIDLSRSLPIVENMSMRAIDHHSYHINGPKNMWIHYYVLEAVGADEVDVEYIRPVFEEMLKKVLLGEVANNQLNKLVLRAGLNWRGVFLISAMAAYLCQIDSRRSSACVQEALVKNPNIVAMLLELFGVRLKCGIVLDREETTKLIVENIKEQMATIESVVEDSVMRSLLEIVSGSIVRTNYYQSGGNKDYVSFKVLSDKISFMPLPKPFAEIFVYSSYVEGVHLRSDRVSRGGLRWSDRYQDYRTEVLGLMKAQVTKNSIIVPGGAKGGFVVKGLDASSMSRDDYISGAMSRYKVFLRGLLDITDNIVDNCVVRPSDTFCLDGDKDPYLVVAADKGTATFSDTANEVSAEYSFWLGDAFASGGSAGYDHKKMGITAKGAWVSTLHHLSAMGIDINKQAITVAGIGDMSGDVFGNGMLMSKGIKLVAAFNHMHVFLDPDPDPVRSYEERARLFALPRSTWADYDPLMISDGGMVISRKAKSVALTAEAAAMLDIDQSSRMCMAVDDVISAILCMRATLLWNGGIGVYIKAAGEINDRVGDRVNDGLRVNGSQVRAKMIVEGGNLGVTQLGRIEYSRCGGLINTDFVDNCGGVHCSDREVNIKIVFSMAMERKIINIEERNALLATMEGEIAEMVLGDNLIQVNALSVAELRCKRDFSSYCRFVDRLESMGILDSAVEFMPNAAGRAKMAIEGLAFSRPELAVLLAYAKIWLRKELISSSLPDEDCCSYYLLQYFPKPMRERFSDVIKDHPLRREIIANFIAGMLVNRMGITMVSDIMDSLGVSAAVVVRAHIVFRESFGVQWMFDQMVQVVSHSLDVSVLTDFICESAAVLEYGVRWIIRSNVSGVEDAIDRYRPYVSVFYKPYVDMLYENIASVLPAEIMKQRQSYSARLAQLGLDSSSASELLATLSVLMGSFGIITISMDMKIDLLFVAKLHLLIEDCLDVGSIKRILVNMQSGAHWRRMSVIVLFDELSDVCAAITRSALSHAAGSKDVNHIFERWAERNVVAVTAYRNFMREASTDVTDFHAMLLLVRHLKSLAA